MRKSNLYEPDAVERLRQTILATDSFQAHLPPEPDWQAAVDALKLSPDKTATLVTSLKRLWLLPFADKAELVELLIFKHTGLALHEQKARTTKNERRLRLCALYHFFVEMALQGNSIFPQNPTHLARQIQVALDSILAIPDHLGHLGPLLELLVDPITRRPKHGFNAGESDDPNLIVLAEHERLEGITEGRWKAPNKFDDYKARVLANLEFHADWATIRKHFKVVQFQDSREIIRRSPLPERNWQQPQRSNLSVTAQRFRVAFDFFCWKWFLYGMRGDEPLVEKLSITLTPFGTQIFIPGYWSFDAARDLDWKKVLQLHRARGVARQGKKLADNQRERAEQHQRLREANLEARRQNLRGAKRYEFLKRKTGLAAGTDDAQVRRMLREAPH